MRTDRLYAITVYLMNHGKTSAGELARRFEVSVRTIQRDMDSLCAAGIPIAATAGINGGYELAERFTLNNQIISRQDYSHILTALNGLATATGDRGISDIYEKISPAADGNQTGMILDFSVLQEGNSRFLPLLQTAVSERKAVRFRYTNSKNETKIHTVEPIAVIYRWYAWYLLAYSTEKEDYRTYKLLRMENLETTDLDFTREHGCPEKVLAEHDRNNTFTQTTVTVKCDPDYVMKTAEYLNGRVTKYLDDKKALMELSVVESEQLWIGTLLSLGDHVEIVSPEHIKQRVLDCAEKIISLYRKP